MVCADTSFLFSLYGHDAHTPKALRRLQDLGAVLWLSPLNEFELANALRFAEGRGVLPAPSAEAGLKALAEDRANGIWRTSDIALPDIVAEAFRLSASHTLKGGHRSFDILHVAHARLAQPEAFLSFDANQLRLAKKAGLAC